MKLSADSMLMGASVTVVVGSLLAGLYMLGSPQDERSRRVDSRRVVDLQGITAATDLYWTRHSELPASMDELTGEPGVDISIVDPVTSEMYAYQPVDSIGYELCATFELPSDQMSRDPRKDLFAHGTGRQCFQLEARNVIPDER
jgi:hypothetical protein